MPFTTLPPGQFIRVVGEEQLVSFVSVALASVALFDHVMTVDEEIVLVWKRPKMSIVQMLYVICTYLGDVGLIYAAAALILNSRGHCIETGRLADWLGLITLWMMQGIMVFRISAMYAHSRKIVVVLVTTFVLVFLSVIVIHILSITRFRPDPRFVPNTPFCVPPLPGMTYNYIFWIPILVFELLMVVLSLYKGIRYYLEQRKTGTSTILSSSGRRSIAYLLFRDSIFFPLFALVSCLYHFVGLMSGTFSPTTNQMGFSISIFVPRIIGSRLVINLKETYYRPFEREFSKSPTESGDTLPGPMVFARRATWNHDRSLVSKASSHLCM